MITLAIIGIVAALTIPTLISTYKKKVYSARLKEFYSVMSQAIKLSVIDNGSPNYWNKLPIQLDDDGNVDVVSNRLASYDFFHKYLAKYLKYSKETIAEDNYFYFDNGTRVYIYNGSCVDLRFDMNGVDGPNQQGYDGINFLFCMNDGGILVPTGKPSGGMTRVEALDSCKSSPITCANLLEIDNWEFKEDYPYKF